MSAMSRNKGSAFERAVAKELFLLTGVTFKRDLDQYRASDRGDLIPDDPAWPFLCECKAYATGTACRPAWQEQATRAAMAAGTTPAVIFKYDRRPVRVSIPLSAICPDMPASEWVEITLQAFAALAAEKMAEGAR